VTGRQHVVAQAEAVHRAGLEVLGHDVEVGDQVEEQRAAGRVLEVEPDAALAEVVAQERGADPPAVGVEHVGERPPACLAGRRVLDLHHVRTQAGQELRAVGQRLHLLGRENPHPVEGAAVAGRLGVDHVTESHGRMVRTDLTRCQFCAPHGTRANLHPWR
jgi:hypothetical protein